VEHEGTVYFHSIEVDNDLERHPGKSGFEDFSRHVSERESPFDISMGECFRVLFPDRFYRLVESCSPKNTSRSILSGERLSLPGNYKMISFSCTQF
jgi:hypothetical protein